jgi:hypothetical protein
MKATSMNVTIRHYNYLQTMEVSLDQLSLLELLVDQGVLKPCY